MISTKTILDINHKEDSCRAKISWLDLSHEKKKLSQKIVLDI